ncbi:hypothetical protein [Nocardia sp. CA-290969]
MVQGLGLEKEGYSSVANRKVTVGLREIALGSPENSFYQHLVDQYHGGPG